MDLRVTAIENTLFALAIARAKPVDYQSHFWTQSTNSYIDIRQNLKSRRNFWCLNGRLFCTNFFKKIEIRLHIFLLMSDSANDHIYQNTIVPRCQKWKLFWKDHFEKLAFWGHFVRQFIMEKCCLTRPGKLWSPVPKSKLSPVKSTT